MAQNLPPGPETLQAVDQRPSAAKLGFDPVALKERYIQERDKRLHKDRSAQYGSIDDGLKHMVDDTFIEEQVAREPVHKAVDVVIIGGGYGGQLAAVRLLDRGVRNFLIIEKGADFGGVSFQALPPMVAPPIDYLSASTLRRGSGIVSD